VGTVPPPPGADASSAIAWTARPEAPPVILVDTSTWIDHFRRASPPLVMALTGGQVGLHPFVLGELALGTLPARRRTLALLETLPCLQQSTHGEVLDFVARHHLVASGIGWVDAHLLCAVQQAGWQLWTVDRPVRVAAARLGLA
jgi:hypothetical protein